MFGKIFETIHENKLLEVLIVVDAGTRLVGKCRHTGKEYLLNRDRTTIVDEELEEEYIVVEEYANTIIQELIVADMQKEAEDMSALDDLLEDWASQVEFYDLIENQ